MIYPVDLNHDLNDIVMLKDRYGHQTDEASRKSFAKLSDYRDGGIFVADFSGSSGWERHPMGGTSCEGPSSSLGFHGGYVYCGTLTPDDPSTRVSVAGNEATIIDLPGGNRIWFVYSAEQAEPERGS